jgi:hypothetical protein
MLNRDDLLKKNRALTREALRKKIDLLGSHAGLAVENSNIEQADNCDPLYAALQIIAREYRLQWKDSDRILSDNSNLPWDERLELAVRKNNWRMRQINLPEEFYREHTTPLLGYVNNEPAVLYLNGGNSYFISAKMSEYGCWHSACLCSNRLLIVKRILL